MNEADRRLWPYTPREAIYAAVATFLVLLLTFAWLWTVIGWPSGQSESIVLVGVPLVSLLPIALVFLDIMMQRGGLIEYRGVMLDFTHVRDVGTSGVTVDENIGVRGHAIQSSATTQILEPLRKATADEVVVIDLKDGRAWWETRLLVLLEGAERLGKPEVVVFVGTEAGKPQRFQGWGYADELLHVLTGADPQYRQTVQRARAAGRQWDLVEPKPLGDPRGAPRPPDPFRWMWVPESLATLATRFPWMAFEDGTKHDLFVEQVLAHDLGVRIEAAWEDPQEEADKREVTLRRLEELFRPVLHRESVDHGWSDGRQIDGFLGSDDEYLVLTRRGGYEGMVARLTVLNEFVRSMVERPDD